MKITPAIFLLSLSVLACTITHAQNSNCEITTFQKTYGKPGISDLVLQSDIIETPDHGYITGGWGGDVADHPIYLKLDSRGNVVWSKQFSAPGTHAGSISRFLRLKDGNYLGLGGEYDGNPNLWLIKFDENGNSIWQKQLNFSPLYSVGAGGIKEMDDGAFIIAGYYNRINFTGSFTAKVDANGNFLWNKLSAGIMYTPGMTEKNGFLYTVGFDGQQTGIISKFKSSDGSFLQSFNIKVDGQETILFSIEAKNNKLYVAGANRNATFDEKRHFIIILDESLTVLKVHKFYFNFKYSMDDCAVLVSDDGGYTIAENSEGYGDLTLFRMSYDGDIKWKRQYPRPGAQVTACIRQTYDNGIIGVGNTNEQESWFYIPGNDIFIFKTDSTGLTGDCDVTDPAITISIPPVERTVANYTFNPSTFTVQPFNDPGNYIVIPGTTFCEKVIAPTCTDITLNGSDTVCSLSGIMEYKAKRNIGCLAPVTWKADAAFTRIVSSTDSAVQVQFLKPGATKLVCSVSDLCETINDSVTVHLFDAPQSLNIGPDILLCENSSHTLHATPGFTRYRWQNGSTDSIFVAQAPGRYYVDAISCAGEIFSDTVSITAAPAPTGYLGKDTAICEGQPAIISSQSQFNKYLWSSGEQTQQINITTAALYWLQVTDVNGCVGKDSINITAKAGCVTELYFPSAFSPNNDGRNDNFRAIPFGYLNKYHLKIFNRYGNIVFETTDITKGWDGTFQSKPQDIGSFVWYCEYQINNQPARAKRGIVTLIR
ncbi:MAG: T9SS type B sorting domain-containing protein [Bacteroidota bacterium]